MPLAFGVIAAVAATSGGSPTDPPVPRGLPGPLPVFMGGGDREGERRWLARARPLGPGAPGWARRMHRRSLLVLRALTDPHSGAAVAGAREGWAYVWPRDAGAVAIAFAEAGYRREARRVARFLLGLDLDAAARFRRTGEPVPARDAQGDAMGWVAAAARAAGLDPQLVIAAAAGAGDDTPPREWRGQADYQEKDPGDYLGNAVATAGLLSSESTRAPDERATVPGSTAAAQAAPAALLDPFESRRGLVRAAGDPGSGLDSAAAWAVRPFQIEALYPAARRTLRLLAAGGGSFGIVPSENWQGGEDPWTAPTAWSAWALAALARGSGTPAGVRREDRRAALALLAPLRRASTPLGLLPERVDADTGAPRSTTPLAWSHAFAILAIRELWPGRAGG